MTTNTTIAGRETRRCGYAADIERALALRFLSRYRDWRCTAESHGADVSAMIEPPSYAEMTASYGRLVEDRIDEIPTGFQQAGALIDLLSVMAADRFLDNIMDDSAIVPPTRDDADAMRALGSLRRWINNAEISEAVIAERAQFAGGGGGR